MTLVELTQLNRQQFDRFRTFIYKTSGIRINDNRISLLSNRIRRRLKAEGFADFDAYYRHLTSRGGAGELEHFLDAITTNETFFFRTSSHFDWFKNQFLGEVLAAERRGERERSLRIWSAACASGAEPYTIAICIAENSFRLSDWSVTVLGTDISQSELRNARAGVFKSRALESVSAKQLNRFFLSAKDEELWETRPELKQLVQFKHHNLMQPMGQRLFDCIFLRNVLIYFDRESKQIVVDNLVEALVPDGYLVVGPSEGVYELMGSLKKHSTFLYQKV